MIRLFTILALLAAGFAHGAELSSVQLDKSSIAFVSRQMNVPVEGAFRKFAAQIHLDPARPEAGRAQIDIDLASIDAGSREADEEAAGKLWFNRSAYPKATFVSSSVRALGDDRYEMRGTLTLKGRSRELVVPVRFVPGKTAAGFDGSFILKRLDFGIGEGMWADVATVANEVRVTFRIAATGK